jgi:hypothetical protein
MAKIYVSFNLVGITENVIVVAREMSNLVAEVDRIFYAAPHSQRNFTFINLNPVMHQIEIWTTSGSDETGPLLALKGKCDIDASIDNDVSFSHLSFVVDRGYGAPNYDPISGDNTYVNPELDIGIDYMVFKSGFGPLIFGIHIEKDAHGFHFIDGQIFSNGEEYSLLVFKAINTATVSGKAFPDDIIELAINTDFGTTHYNKIIEANSFNTIVNLTILDMNLLPENLLFGINTHGGNQRYVALILPIGAICNVSGVPRNIIYLAKGESATFIKKAGALRIINWNGDYTRIGERVSTDGKPPVNGLAETGGWYLKADYPRLYEWYVNELPMGNFGVGVQDTIPDQVNRGKWIIGSTKFWVPDRSSKFDRNAGTTGRVSGDYEVDGIKAHFHDVGTANNIALTPTDPRFNRSLRPHTVRSWNVANHPDLNQLASTDLNYNDAEIEETETRGVNMTTHIYRIF